MDFLLICRDGLEDSLIGNIAFALEAKKNGSEVGVLFTQEALIAFGGKAFQWSPLLGDRDSRMKVSKHATEIGIQIASERDKRWTDVNRLIKSAKDAGISLMACPLWSKFLEVEDKLPQDIKIIDNQSLLKEMKEAKTIIGGF